jgi:hypothetical protein
MNNFTSISTDSVNTQHESGFFKDLILLRSETELINLEDDSIVTDLFTNTLSMNSVHIFSNNSVNQSLNFSTTLSPLTSTKANFSNPILLNTSKTEQIFNRDLASLLKIY